MNPKHIIFEDDVPFPNIEDLDTDRYGVGDGGNHLHLKRCNFSNKETSNQLLFAILQIIKQHKDHTWECITIDRGWTGEGGMSIIVKSILTQCRVKILKIGDKEEKEYVHRQIMMPTLVGKNICQYLPSNDSIDEFEMSYTIFLPEMVQRLASGLKEKKDRRNGDGGEKKNDITSLKISHCEFRDGSHILLAATMRRYLVPTLTSSRWIVDLNWWSASDNQQSNGIVVIAIPFLLFGGTTQK